MARTPHRLTDLVRGLIALLVLLAALTGVPAGLHAFWHPAWPTPTITAITHALTSPDNGSALYLLLGVVGWAAWGAFTLAVVLELPAQLRRRPTVRLPGLGWAQSAVAALLTAIFVAISAPTVTLSTHVGPAAAVPAATSVSVLPAAAVAGAAHEQSTAPEPAVPAAAGTELYTVQPGDSTYSLAQTHLGNPDQWRAIAALNDGRVMADGVVFRADGPLRPGWVIALPAAETEQVTLNAAPMADDQGTSVTYTVQPGDNLWTIAEKYLGSGADYPQIFQENEGRPLDPAGDELTDPNLILPGEDLTIQVDATAPATPAAPSATAPPAPVAAPSDTHNPASVAANPNTAAPTPATTAPTTSAPTPNATAPGAPASPGTEGGTAPSSPVGHHGAPEHRDVVLDLAAAFGALSLAVLLATVARRRALQQRSRRTGERIDLPAAASTVNFERQARAGQGTDALVSVDRALRELAGTLRATHVPLPPLRGALYHPDATFELRLDEPADLPTPWHALDPTRQRWSRPTDLGALTAEPAPYPALVDLGTTEDGTIVLIDLEQTAPLTLSGTREDCEAVLARIVLHLADSPWADHLTVHLAEFGRELADALGSDRVQYHDRLTDALDDLSDWAAAVSEELTERGHDSVRHARTDPDAAGTWPPHLLLAARALTTSEHGRLTYVLTTTPAPSIAAVVPHPEHHSAGPDTLHVVLDAPTTIPGLGIQARLHHIPLAELPAALDLLASSANLVSRPDPVWAAVLSGTAAQQHEPEQLLPIPANLGALSDLDEDYAEANVSTDDLDAQAEVVPSAPGTEDEAGPLASATADDGELGQPAQPQGWGTAWPGFQSPALDLRTGGQDQAPKPAAYLPVPATSAGAPAGLQAELGEDAEAEPQVHLLGPVRITGARGHIEGNRRERCLELAAYLCLYPSRGFAQIVTDVWPDAGHKRRTSTTDDDPEAPFGDVPAADDRTRRVRSHHRWTSLLRTWLGKGPMGAAYLPVGQYRFAGVRCDWLDFLDLATQGRFDEALSLVHGVPFDGVRDDRYAWAENARIEMISRIVDVAYTSASAHLQAGRYGPARTAAMIGLSVAPEREDVGRVLIYALLRDGHRTEAINVGRRILDLCEQSECDPQPETLEAVRAANGQRRSSQSVAADDA